ncbi:MAG TPA: NAD-dependent epimerase [Prolixibacteraceae bacterium]|nr:NAD-dependent epimerase [Prolixibacteraceae bacterium]
MKILVTGTAGFIGFHLAKRLVSRGDEVVGLDNINPYYSPALKFARLKECGIEQEKVRPGKMVHSSLNPNYRFVKAGLEEKEFLDDLFETERFDRVCNLAAQAGVRYSLENPQAYIDSNITGFINILEACRKFPVEHLVYASSSSVYGSNTKMPLSTADRTDHPVSLYAATKKSNELMAHAYSHLFEIPSTGLRFFTVYGPWGRPDMAAYLFTEAILADKPIRIFNFGDMYRDFTYIDDIVEGVIRVIDKAPLEKSPPAELLNIGNSSPVRLLDFIAAIETALGREAKKAFVPLQAGDVYKTFADVSDLQEKFGYHPDTPITEGVRRFVEWYMKTGFRFQV